ncbi:FlgO family outer membrane protein [Psychrobium sp. 1_MG-2023]|uniref:FlgO family outer membrane protein n=1 Tax=Psychrobium sp. 1_MG-2023 TaxID=3062624 RepID=UPI000C31BBAB|nr:FlgO family outer membrane protein [Psychrobium sp. 1_MG-2023]MDP2559903.1 FlgO family outer membrane protein [Psychrobium sp. 1_MG-2023]PKF58996.1 hypothetical protein CW748_02065 [Alteromonadales bacterium alter-6D02]
MRVNHFILVLGCFFVFGCQSFDPQTHQAVKQDQRAAYFDAQVTKIADNLIAMDTYQYREKASIVTTFVRLDSLRFKKMPYHGLELLGHQVAQGLTTKLVERGAIVAEHLAGTSVAVSKNASYFLSRDVKKLNGDIQAQYVISGTMSQMEQGIVFNIEVIDLDNQQIVSATDKYFSIEQLIEQGQATKMKNGYIFR